MLSIFDLLDAGTLHLDLAAYLMARIGRGASFLVGANPGGAGKTTLMCAVLNLIPPATRLVAATEQAVRNATGTTSLTETCYVCHEIGNGPYFAYLWDRDLRAYCALAGRGAMLATNLHADTLEEAHEQVCGENGVPEPHFRAFTLALFLRVRGGYFNASRTIDRVYEARNGEAHKLVFDNGRLSPTFDPWTLACRDFLQATHARGVRTIEDTRAAVLAFYALFPPPSTT